MSAASGTTLPKLPFYIADAVLSGLCLFGIYSLGKIEGWGEAIVAAACVVGGGWGAWLAVVPWLREHETNSKLEQASMVSSAVSQIRKLEDIAQTIQNANLQWQTVQQSNNQTVATAQEITRRMKAEADEFMKFLQQADTQEKSAMRLEIQKARKMEEDWLQVVVRMLDHIWALYSAGVRSGQKNLVQQLEQFQGACRDAVRRLGLVPFVPERGEPFDERAHQNAEQNVKPAPGSLVSDTVATGFTFQGALLRRALVRVAPREELIAAEVPAAETPEPNHPQLPLQ